MLKMFKYFKAADWIMLVALAGLIFCQSWLELELPAYTGRIINLVTGAQPSQNLTGDIWKTGGTMLCYALGAMMIMFTAGFLSAKIGARLGKALRQQLFYKIESFSMEELGAFSTSSLITRTTNDVMQVTMAATMGLRFILRAPTMFIIAVIKSQSISKELTLTVAAAILLIVLMLIVLMVLVLPKFKKIQKLVDRINGTTRENLTGLRVVRAYNAEGYQEEKFERENKTLTKTSLFVNKAMALMDPFLTYVMNMISLVIVWLGAYLLLKGSIPDMGVITEFTMYATHILMSFLFIIMLFFFIPRAAVSAKRINEVLDSPLKITDGEGAEPDSSGTVEFKNVSFKYADAEDNVLTDISFSIKKGQTAAFIGSTGSGKSTLIKLIPRFFDVSEGQVLVGGRDVRQYTQKQLMSQIGYVPQKGVLFSGTVRDNIIYGDTESTDAEMQAAAKTARALDFINERSEGFDSAVAQGGANLSGGQKQRVSIARALVKNPDILVFDDSFSALDYKTDKELRAELRANTSSTCLIVAQRIGTILSADKIIVLNHGRIVGEGTHKQLMSDCDVYREIAYSQLSKEELDQ